MTSQENPQVIDVENPPELDGDGDGRREGLLAVDAALAKKALQPVLLNVTGMCSYTNYILVVSGRSDRQVDAIAEGVMTGLKGHEIRPLGIEGRGTGQWVLIDFGDMVVHVFHHPIREHYDIESLWIDAERVALDLPDEAIPKPEDSYPSLIR